MNLKILLRTLCLSILGMVILNTQSKAQVFPGTLEVTNGNIDLSTGFTSNIQFANGSISSPPGIGSFFYRFNANRSYLFTTTDNNGEYRIQVGGITSVGGFSSDPSQLAQFGVVPSGTRNNIAHIESGNFGDINSTSAKWLGLGSAPASAGASAYGKRIQWGQNFGVFNLRQASATDKDLVIQWGGTTANSQLLFEVASSPFTAPTRVMQMESNGNVGIGITPSAADKLRVNGRIRFGSVEFIEDGGGFIMSTNSNILPTVDNARDLGSAAFRWDDVFATNGMIQTSDIRSKKDIKALTYGLDEIMRLRPVTYKWKKDNDKGDQIGLIAQEVQKIMTELVYDPKNDLVEDEEGNLVPLENSENLLLGISYSEFIPVIIKAIQQQQDLLTKQSAEIIALKAQLQEGSVNTKARNETIESEIPAESNEAIMIQNKPNPFNQSTEIGFYLPKTVNSATLFIYNMNGALIDKYDVTDRGASTMEIKANTLNPGIYLYTIVADDQDLGVKRMIIKD